MTNLNIFILLCILYLIISIFFKYNEYFVNCEDTPIGPYLNYCTMHRFNNNLLSAYCPNKNKDNNFIQTSLDLSNCKQSVDCYNIDVDNDGNLVC